MASLTVESIDIRVTRQVVQVTPENVEDGSLADFLKTFNIFCRQNRFPTQYDPETGSYSQEEGIKYYETQTSWPELFYAKYGDFLVILGNKEAYTLTAEELAEKNLGVSEPGSDFREPKLRKAMKVKVCEPRYNHTW